MLKTSFDGKAFKVVQFQEEEQGQLILLKHLNGQIHTLIRKERIDEVSSTAEIYHKDGTDRRKKVLDHILKEYTSKIKGYTKKKKCAQLILKQL